MLIFVLLGEASVFGQNLACGCLQTANRHAFGVSHDDEYTRRDEGHAARSRPVATFRIRHRQHCGRGHLHGVQSGLYRFGAKHGRKHDELRVRSWFERRAAPGRADSPVPLIKAGSSWTREKVETRESWTRVLSNRPVM